MRLPLAGIKGCLRLAPHPRGTAQPVEERAFTQSLKGVCGDPAAHWVLLGVPERRGEQMD